MEGEAVCWESGLRVGKGGGLLEKEPGRMVVLCAPAGKGAAASAWEENDAGGCPPLPALQVLSCKLQKFNCLIPKVFSVCSPLLH